MDTISADRDGYSGREIAVADQADTRARAPDVRYQVGVPRPVENDDGEIFDIAVQTPGNRF
jgi:hypothetical protein